MSGGEAPAKPAQLVVGTPREVLALMLVMARFLRLDIDLAHRL